MFGITLCIHTCTPKHMTHKSSQLCTCESIYVNIHTYIYVSLQTRTYVRFRICLITTVVFLLPTFSVTHTHARARRIYIRSHFLRAILHIRRAHIATSPCKSPHTRTRIYVRTYSHVKYAAHAFVPPIQLRIPCSHIHDSTSMRCPRKRII